MTQTENGMTFSLAQVFVSANGSSWTDVSGHGAAVVQGGGQRGVGEQHTFDGDTPIVSGGKRSKKQLTVRFVYTPHNLEPFEVVRAIHESAPGTIYVQYRPTNSGDWYKTGAGILEDLMYPQGEAGSPNTVMSEFVVSCAALTVEAAST